ncbi:copper resistance protein B [Acinetobacter sp. GFQ9D192M]|uniref:copper resistance protein B n=1 Tax=unclassified Acinetobacter TaxID=196816 RepID=UPI00140CFF4F|nr:MULTISPECIES: copper resistance protein B [unclassified Acinetobacter]NHB65369.1 copper resistance protein B [Acinetobacter sp. GFQ9D191M]NHC01495.1 copper resistance protein B [Acinetobacter sp. GFQ9D192M]
MHTINLCLKPVLASVLALGNMTVFAEDISQQYADHSMHHQQSLQSSEHHLTSVAPEITENLIPDSASTYSSEHDHRKEHGGQIYTRVKLDNKWIKNSEGEGGLQSENELRIGTDENKLFIKLKADKQESRATEYAVQALYSRNISDFWDAQAGLRYRQENLGQPNAGQNIEHVDAIFGFHGLAPYFFETNAHLYLGQDDFIGLELETERDLLLTQKLILQPYVEVDLILKDKAANAKKTGISHAAFGLETRYEVNKKIMPYLDIAYEYSKGNEKTSWQDASDSEQGGRYGIGLRMMF